MADWTWKVKIFQKWEKISRKANFFISWDFFVWGAFCHFGRFKFLESAQKYKFFSNHHDLFHRAIYDKLMSILEVFWT